MGTIELARPTSLTIALALAFLCMPSKAVSPGQPSSFKITAIRALLYFEQTGTFSGDVLADPDFAFWNTIIGEGDAGSPSSATLVQVEVTGEPGSYEPTRKVEFAATYKPNGRDTRELTVTRVTEVNVLSAKGKFYAPFWLYDTGCNPIKLTARITGQAQTSVMKKTINYKCGE